jgi:protein transport protein SEC24
MNSAKPPPPPQRPATSRPPPPPPLRSAKPAAPTSSIAPAAHAPAAMAPVSVPPVAQAPVAAAPGQETRLRVSVKLSVRDPNLLIARPLGAGEPPPPGTREALLILVEPAMDPANVPDGGHTP